MTKNIRVKGLLQALTCLSVFALACLWSGLSFAGVTASISGTVKDASGAAIVGATVIATTVETGVAQTQHTNAQGFYSFQTLPLGHYDIQVQQAGFKAFRETGLLLDVDAALVVDAVLQVGQPKEVVEVSAEALHVETSSTQLGEVIDSKEMTDVPLVSRSYTDLLALQPGVVSTSSGMSGALAGPFNSTGVVMPLVSGDLNAGGLSVNGMREADNGFMLNGATVQEPGFGGTAVIPNLDSIAEFRILTNNFDAEYGNYSGGQINVITKSGTNGFHGDVFEFLRNTDFDASNYFDINNQRGTYHQNQYGGTLGGPIKHDQIFFFGDYQGNRVVQGVSSGNVAVPSAAEHTGDFSDRASSLTGTVVNQYWGNTLGTELGYAVNAGENYYISGCTLPTQCVFPNAQIPATAISAPAKNILPFIPDPNNPGGFSTSSQALRINDNKTSGRVDGNSHLGLLSAYYFLDNYSLSNPYPTASVPGFAAAGKGRTQVVNLGDTKTLGNSSVNEVRFEFVRNHILVNQPANGGATTLSSLGFTTGANTSGIDVQTPAIQGVPELDFQAFTVGVPSRPNLYVENTVQVMDNFSKVVGTHTLRFGASFHKAQMDQTLSNVVNGNFTFNTGSTETGIDFADFLIGAPDQFVQGVAEPGNGRNHYIGLYGQDSWRVRSNLTLDYGLRWDVSSPWSEEHNQIETLVPGKHSATFPGAPIGWVFAGDPGIPSTLAPIRYNNFAPRVGLAYSPNASDGLLAKLTGGPGNTSIRAGFGLFYASFEGATSFNQIGASPFGFFYVGNSPSFTTPFLDRKDSVNNMQRFPVAFPPLNASPSNPDSSVNWSVLLPIASSPGIDINNRLPYAEDYELSIQRQFSRETLLTLSYVGTQGHRLLSTLEANPGNQALCLFLNNPANLAAGSPVCGPGAEDPGAGNPILLAKNVTAPGFPGVTSFATSRLVAGFNTPATDNIQSNGYFTTIGNSGYNSLQVNLRHTSKRFQTLVGYTYSKAVDDASGYGEQINPVNHAASRALSAFDATNNFVVSYSYALPFDKLGGPKQLTNGWQFSGITRFSTGLPVVIYETDDHSLLGTSYTGPIILDVDTPNYTPGPLNLKNPRSGPYFNTSLFSAEPLGQLGNSSRRFFHGPGTNNFDMALLKKTRLSERSDLEFRAEFFNVFNHAQFQNVQGDFNASNFGVAQSASAPRIGQLALKLTF